MRRALETKNSNFDQNQASGTLGISRSLPRFLGALPLSFFLAQAIHYWQINEFAHVLWMCNVGNLLLAIGLFLESRELIRVAIIWTVPGVAVWLLYVVPTWGMLMTGNFTMSQLYGVLSSTLAHLGGISVGLLVLRKVGMDGRAWLYAFVWYFIVQLISRLLTPPALNINLSQRIQDGWEQTFSSYLKFWVVLTIMVGIWLWLIGFLLQAVWPARKQLQQGLP
jgi:hypothetical protein